MALKTIGDFTDIAIDLAAEMTKAWQEEHIIKAFLFHKNDIECLAQQEEVVGVRFYIGITEKEDEDDAPDMIVVGVNSLNEDIINEDVEVGALEVVSGIYDFALPCPKLCDPESLLGGGQNTLRVSRNSTSQMRTVRHSTEEECFIDLGAISKEDAVERLQVWQCELKETLISIYFDIEDLDSIFNEFISINADTNALRVYFGVEDGVHRVILIGATNTENSYYSDIETPNVYINTKAPCTSNGEGSCAVNRDLYLTCN